MGACAIAVPLAVSAAWAAEPAGQPVTLYDAAGRPVAVLTPLQVGALPAGMPMMRMMDAQQAAFGDDPFARMDAMMNAMMARMDALSAMPMGGPGGMIDAGLPQGVAPGRMVVRTFTSNGRGSCQQTVTYGGGGQQPVVQQVGDACGAVATPGPQATTPAVQPAPVEQRPDRRMYRIDYRRKARALAALRG